MSTLLRPASSNAHIFPPFSYFIGKKKTLGGHLNFSINIPNTVTDLYLLFDLTHQKTEGTQHF